MLPPQQRFATGDRAACRRGDRLIVQDELVIRRLSQAGLYVQRLPVGTAGGRIKQFVAGRTERLGAAQGRLGAAQQRVCLGVLAAAYGDADTHGGEHFFGTGAKWRGDLALNSFSDSCCLRRFGETIEQNRKLVAAKASDNVARAQAGFQALGNRRQQFISRLVPESFVD